MTDTNYRLLPVALHPAIEEALKRHCMMPNTAWQDVIAAWDRLRDEQERVQKVARNAIPYAAPERSGKTADEGLDFTKPLETVDGKRVTYICSDVIEIDCARVCVDQATGIVYSSPCKGVKIRNSAPAASSSASPSDERHFTPMTATGTVVYLGRSGGFDVRHCPEAEYLASFIAAACNAYAALATPSVQAAPPPAPIVPDGWKLVPIKPTPEMLNALSVSPDMGPQGRIIRYSVDKLPGAYSAMLAAAPTPPSLAGDTQAGE